MQLYHLEFWHPRSNSCWRSWSKASAANRTGPGWWDLKVDQKCIWPFLSNFYTNDHTLDFWTLSARTGLISDRPIYLTTIKLSLSQWYVYKIVFSGWPVFSSYRISKKNDRLKILITFLKKSSQIQDFPRKCIQDLIANLWDF